MLIAQASRWRGLRIPLQSNPYVTDASNRAAVLPNSSINLPTPLLVFCVFAQAWRHRRGQRRAPPPAAPEEALEAGAGHAREQSSVPARPPPSPGPAKPQQQHSPRSAAFQVPQPAFLRRLSALTRPAIDPTAFPREAAGVCYCEQGGRVARGVGPLCRTDRPRGRF